MRSPEEWEEIQREGTTMDLYNITEKLRIDANPNAARSCMADWYDQNPKKALQEEET